MKYLIASDLHGSAEYVGRLMDAAYLAGGPAWVVHLSTREGLAIARRARERGPLAGTDQVARVLSTVMAANNNAIFLITNCKDNQKN